MMSDIAITLLLCIIITAGVFGIFLNSGILTLGGLKPELRVDYSWFLFGMAVLNLIYACDILVLQPWTILNGTDPRDPLCQAAGFVLIVCAEGAILTQPLLALNRYSMIFHKDRHSKTFCKRNIFLMTLANYTLGVCVATAYLLFGDYGRFFDSLCCIDIFAIPVSHFVGFFMAPVCAGYGVSIFCAVKISRHLKRHEQNVQQRELRSGIKETKQIVRLICIEIATPVCLESPLLIYCVLGKYVQVPDVAVAIAIGLFVMHAVTDPVVVLLIVKPYGVALKKIWNKVVHNRVEPTGKSATTSNRESKY